MAVPGFFLPIMWVMTILDPRKTAKGMDMTVPRTVGLLLLFTAIWLSLIHI